MSGSNTGNGINPSEHLNNEETNISFKSSENDNDDEDTNYELAAEIHFNDEASEESEPTLPVDDLANHSKEVQGKEKRQKRGRSDKSGWIQVKNKMKKLKRRRIRWNKEN
ncbi:hypothetical protein HHI36_014303 [Cryptolaemus montrouzieri]|uniref:Uncharacterized protein n=1 Tax=Cryptolaemus montrouzieri TaxID=559131 RepID=A0ABD2N2X6_9CUCU